MPEQPKRVLIIDDQAELCELMNAQLRSAGFEFRQSYDGEGGFLNAVKEPPDCILLDVRMPRLDGLSFLRKLRSYRDEDPDKEHKVRKIPVVVLTAAGDNMKGLFEMEGVQEYVSKPFDIQRIKACLNAVIEASKSS